MRALLLTLALAIPAVAHAQTPDEAAVRAVVQAYEAARDAQDPAAVAALFTPDADQRTTGGEWRRGLDAIVKGTAASSASNAGARRVTVEAVRFVSPDVALVDGPYGAGTAVRGAWATLVLRREAGSWRIAAIRNAMPTGR